MPANSNTDNQILKVENNPWRNNGHNQTLEFIPMHATCLPKGPTRSILLITELTANANRSCIILFHALLRQMGHKMGLNVTLSNGVFGEKLESTLVYIY